MNATERLNQPTYPFDPDQVGPDRDVYEPLARCREQIVRAQVHLTIAAEAAHAKNIDVRHLLDMVQRLRDCVREMDRF